MLPGLIDAHTHIFLQGEEPAEGGYDVQLLKYPLAYRAARATVSARRALEQGFTTIRDVETEGAGYGDVGIKQAIEEGHIPGPRMFVSTRAISTTGGYHLEGYAPEIDGARRARSSSTARSRRARRRASSSSNGADWIKVYMTHRSWVDEDGQPRLAADAHRRGAAARSSTRRTAGEARSPATRTTAPGCSARSTAAATRSSTASSSTTPPSRRWCKQGTWLRADARASTTTTRPARHAGRQARPQARRASTGRRSARR